MSTHNNYTTIETVCPECKTQPVIRDNIRQETYCNKCGLVIEDQTIPSITTIISQREKQKKEELEGKIETKGL